MVPLPALVNARVDTSKVHDQLTDIDKDQDGTPQGQAPAHETVEPDDSELETLWSDWLDEPWYALIVELHFTSKITTNSILEDSILRKVKHNACRFHFNTNSKGKLVLGY